MNEITYTETLKVTTCWCGINLAIPSNLYRVAHDDGKSVYCPLGHSFSWGNSYKEKYEAEKQRVERERQRVRATQDLLRAEERSHSATRGVLTKTKKRMHNGVCPCCNRSFANVERHMKTKHPDYVKEAVSDNA